ncbi:MAG: putative rane protein [Gemmatimonadetes bacterium]|nr:putative rane protein [Gemmatimonadota bacterium]
MLAQLDRLIREVLVAQIAALTSTAQVRFQPPDAAFRTDVVNMNAMALNVYLADLRENRKLRTNERLRTLDAGVVFTEQAPDRMDCLYLISAWSPAQPGPGVEPTIDEHALLYETAAVLTLEGDLNPTRVYAPGAPDLALWPARFRDVSLPAQVLHEQATLKLSDFWSSMGADARWRPVVALTVTLPIALVRELSGPMVTTMLTRYRMTALAVTDELWMHVGGQIVDTTTLLPDGSPTPVAGAWVRLETLTGVLVRRAVTDALGRFRLDQLRGAQYRIRTGAVGLGELSRLVDVPTETGEYDLQFP